MSFVGVCEPAWKDPSPHIVRFVEVEPGTRLEVLDWGGSGETVLLLAGHGDTGHIFDDFAPSLSKGFRVLALTRRGFGASAQPERGYELSTLVRDIARVIESLHLPQRVHLVGHSIAGDEMTRFASIHPGSVGKLVYLDAAYDRVEAREVEKSFPRLPPFPGPTRHELASPATVRAFVGRTTILMPESEIRATRVFRSEGRFLQPVTPAHIVSAVARMVEHPDYSSIRAPILAIYAVPTIPVQLVPRYKTADQERRLALNKIFNIWKPAAKAQRDYLRKTVPGSHIVEIEGASHYVFISHRKRVLEEVTTFLGKP